MQMITKIFLQIYLRLCGTTVDLLLYNFREFNYNFQYIPAHS